MTRLLNVMLSLMMIFALAACGSASLNSVQTSQIPTTPVTPAEPAVTYAVELTTQENASQAKDGSPLVSYSYELPQLRALRSDGTVIEAGGTEQEEKALAVTKVFNDKFSSWTSAEDFDALTQEAEAELTWRKAENLGWTTGYVLDLDCTVYQTDQLVSVSGLYYSSIDGAAHPNTWLLSWNFDLETGTYFDPDMLAENTEFQSAVTEEIIRQAGEPRADGTIPAESYWEDYREIVANWGTAAVSFDEQGMTVAFSPYELAPYVFGEQVFQIPYDFLKPYLSAHGQKILGLEEK